MIKRTLSLVLCLIMVLGLATPAVQATGTDSVYSDDIMDNIVIEDGANVDIVVDGNSVSTSQDTKLPNPVDLVTEPTEPPYYEGTPVVDAPVVKDVCKCVDLASAVDHSGVCLVKAPYIAKCDASAEELFAGWANFTLVEQDFLLKYLEASFPQKYHDLEKLLSAPTGSASETYVDGTTVSVEGIPQDGSLTVGNADAVKDIVDAYVAENVESSTELFSYDVSVQDGEGADWQPETSVKMELELPGAKLHKNTKVFVVHVDDNGVATTIEAQVTEDGKVAFETPGFSAFYGFTVDFHYEDVTFSIPGMSSIKLSELFEELKMPLNASDVVALDYTDDTQIKIEQLDGDWLLTSLKAFDTEEKLTMTMADGSVHEIKVTDLEVKEGSFTWNLYNGYWGTGVNHIYAPEGLPTSDSNSYTYEFLFNKWYSSWNGNEDHLPDTLYFDGTYGSAQTSVITINPGTQDGHPKSTTLYVDMVEQWRINNGANVTIQLGSAFDSSIVTEVVFRARKADWAYFYITNGSLTLKGTAHTKLVLEFDTDGNGTADNTKFPIIWEESAGSGTARSLTLENVTFRHSKYAAIDMHKSQITNISLKNCTFESTVTNVSHGGAIRFRNNGLALTKFEAIGCIFNGTKANNSGKTVSDGKTEYHAARGGAIAIQRNVATLKFENCQFLNTNSDGHGGAICVNNDGDTAVAITTASFKGCTFSGCSSKYDNGEVIEGGRGGAVRIISSTATTLTIDDCDFTDCETYSHGGAFSWQGKIGNITIQNGSTFSDCTAGARGGALGISCPQIGNITLSGSTFSGNTSGTLGGGAHFGLDSASAPITAGAVSVSGCEFLNNKALGGIGGGICLTDGTYESVSFTNSTFDGCTSANFGGGIAIKCYSEDQKDKLPVKVTGDTIISGCTFRNCMAGGLSANGFQDTDKKVPVTWDHDGNPDTLEIDQLNGTGGGGAICLGGTYSYVEIVGSSNSSRMLIENCASWNNGGAIVFNSDMVVTGKTVSGVKKGVRLEFVDINKCFARDSGNAVYFAAVQIDPFDMANCTVQNCDSFDVARTTSTATETAGGVANGNKTYFDALVAHLDLLNNTAFGAPGALSATEQAAMIQKWKGYGLNSLVKSFDAGGTLRTVGDAAVAATIKDCIFQYNGSFCNGGGVYWNANTVITDAETGEKTLIPKVDITNVTFTGNRATGQGGGLYCEAAVKVLSCTFTENSANYGGGISQNMYNNSSRQLGTSGDSETNNLELGAAEGLTNSDGTPKVTKIYNNTANYGAGISITVGGTDSYPHTTSDSAKPEDMSKWTFKKDFTYEVKFKLGGSHIYENKATKHGGGIYYSATYYGDLTGNDSKGIPYSERQRQVDSFVKDIQIDDGLIYSNIAGNGATADNGGGGNGGGIYMNSNQKNTEDTIASGEKTGSSTVSITGGSIYSNTATIGNGGGVYLQGKNALCTISGDSAVGALLTKGPDGEVSLSEDGRNTATGKRTGINQYTGGNGGGIAIFGGARIEMEGGYVYNNESTTAGGGIAVHDKSSMYISDGYVDKNVSCLGGGISLNDSQAPKTTTETKYQYGMYFEGGNVRQNTVTPNGDNKAYGGGICLAKSTMLIDDGDISENVAHAVKGETTYTYSSGQEGGGIAVCQSSEMKINGGVIKSNKAYDGGGMVIRGGSTVTMSGSITVINGEVNATSAKGVIRDNYAYHDGGGVNMMSGNAGNGGRNSFTLNSGWVYSNDTSTSISNASNGGGFYVNELNDLTINGGRIEDNTCNYHGGGIYAYKSIVKISNGDIIENIAKKRHGGGVYVSGCQLYLNGTSSKMAHIADNKGFGCGGGLYAFGSILDIDYMTSTNNTGKYGGGAYFEKCTTTIDGGMFTYNRSNQGAGLFVRGGDTTINKGDFNYNVCGDPLGNDVGDYDKDTSQYGGGLLVDSQNQAAKVVINDGNFKNNNAPHGAGMWLVSNSKDTSKLVDVTINGGTIQSNEASGDGGGILLDGQGLVITANGTVTGATTLTMNGGIISDNTATSGNGGGVCVMGQARAVITTGTVNGEKTVGKITENSAKNGGGVYVTSGGHLTVTNGYITYNKAVEPGGHSILTTCLGYDSQLWGTGGGICVTSGASDTAKSTFVLNSESDNNDMAIYGNEADFAADDVFASSNNTKLDVPEVQDMNLAGYGSIKPEGWVEDYCTDDVNYENVKGLNMLWVNYDGTSVPVLRYRSANATQRRHMVIITTKPGVTNPPNYVTGDNVPSGTAYVNMDNAYVCMTLGIPATADDTVVVDYGIKVSINVYENDLFMNGGSTDGDFGKGSTSVYGSYLYKSFAKTDANNKDNVYYTDGATPYAGYTESVERSHGTMTNDYNGYFVWTPKNMLHYTTNQVTYTVRHNDVWYYAYINVIPATSIYFEDSHNSITYHDNTKSGFIKKNGVTTIVDTLAPWTTVGTEDTNGQSQDRPGTENLKVLDANNIYGYDGTYSSLTGYTFSRGQTHKVTVYRDPTDPSKTTNARAVFTFKGTGFDVISMCSQKTGMVSVSVYSGDGSNIIWDDDPSTSAWEPTTPVKSWVVDTYYKQGGTTDTSTSNLYQVPIIKCSGLDYGTYTVEIYVAPNFNTSSAGYMSADFFLDAVRIYDPAGIGGAGGSSTVRSTYNKDGERWPTYQEIRNMLIEQEKLSDNTKSGAIFIDGNNKPTLADYKSFGPNNEVYLASGCSIAFTLNELNYVETLEEFTGTEMTGVVNKIHIAMRGLGSEGNVRITADGVKTKTYRPTATDMYYDISDFRNQVVTIKNNGFYPVALSTIKVTHTQDVSAAAVPAMMCLMTVDNETARIALEMLNADQLSEPELTPKYPALSYNGMICYNVFFDAQELGNLTEADLGLAIFDTNDEDGTVETAKDVIYGATKIDDLYMITSNGVHAKYLGDTQYFRVFAKNADGSYTYSKMVSYSAAQYARGVLAKSNDVKLKQLAVAMLNYGAEAQKFFNYKTDNLMNRFVTADDQALVADFSAASLKSVGKVDASKVGAFGSTGGFTRRTPSISFKGAFEINYFFTPANAVDGDMTLYFWNEDTYNSVSELTADNADKAVVMPLVNGAYIATSDEIIAKELDQTVYVAAVYESNGVTYCSGVLPYSIAAYCQNPPAGVQDLANAAAVYGCAAKEFFGA